MIALGVRYLTRYAVATNLSRQRAEWPPHPGRIFMALAAAYFESGADPAERAALEWLEAKLAPSLHASEADERTIVRAYVPVNDEHGGIERRPRQDRAFPCARPHDDCVYLIWDDQPAAEVRDALANLCGKVTRVGHSSSAVQMWVVPAGEEPAPNWLAGDQFQDTRLRVAGAGTLRMLENAFNGQAIQEYDALAEAAESAKGKQRTALKKELRARFPDGRPEPRRPQLVNWQGYGRPEGTRTEVEVLEGPFDENFVVLAKIEGIVLGLESTLQLTGALRNAAMKAAGERPPEWLSGHDENGVPSRHPHVAFFPLPYVGFEHADGHILGLGMAVPRTLRVAGELRRFLGPLYFDQKTGEERTIKLWNSGTWNWEVAREMRERPPLSLRRITWTGPSCTWASVTPVVLHHHPKKRPGDVERIIREAFVSALLPEPETLEVRSVSRFEGVSHVMAMPAFAEGGPNLCRYQVHVVARFAQPLRGPMLVGRGRFRGYGLFRPVAEERS